MDVSMIPHVAQRLLELHGLAAQGWTFAWDHARRRAGRCYYGRKTITMSRHYAELNIVSNEDDIIDTILHEIAHALTPGAGHGDDWKDMCRRVGAKPERCYDSAVVQMPMGRYLAVCAGCDREFRRHKRGRAHTWRYCVSCGPERGRLTFHDTTTAAVHIDTTTQTTRDVPPPPRKLR